MLESKLRYVLKNKRTGLYWGHKEPVKKLFDAKRFLDMEQIDTYLTVSIYAPGNPDEYEPIQVRLQINEVGDAV